MADFQDAQGPGLDDELDSPTGSQSQSQTFGKMFIDGLYKILKVGSIYSVEHNQTRQAIAEFMPFFQKAIAASGQDAVNVVIRGELGIVNGETLRLRRREQVRFNELRDLFAAAQIRGLVLKGDMGAEDLVQFLVSLNQAAREGQGMGGANVPGVDIRHGSPDQSVPDAIHTVNKSMYSAHVYIRGMVKLKATHDQMRAESGSNIPTGVIKRILQAVSELLSDEDYTILGLLPLKLVPPDLVSHSMNTAIYAMLLADRLGLPVQTVTHVGMAMIYQDLDRLGGVAVGHRDRDTAIDPQQQYAANLRDSALMLNRLDGDIVSTLRVLLAYERGCPVAQPIGPPFYRTPRNLHLISRIGDVARTFDLLIQGLEGYKARRPDLALQYLVSRAGEVFDHALVQLMISTLGIFPIGSTVQLSTGERAVVIRTPAPSANPRRPVVRLLNRHQPTVMDLSDARYQHVDIARTIEAEEDTHVSSGGGASQIFLLT